jgi:hypothetical protein
LKKKIIDGSRINLVLSLTKFLLQEYLFNPKVLISNGPPPNDRGCLICGKVGHKAKECENRGNRNRGQDKNSPQQQQQQRDNPQNPAQEVHNRNMVQQRDRGVGPGQPHQQQMNRYRPQQGFHQFNRDRPGQQQPQVNRYRPIRPNNRPGVPLNSNGERIYTARREIPDPNQQ